MKQYCLRPIVLGILMFLALGIARSSAQEGVSSYKLGERIVSPIDSNGGGTFDTDVVGAAKYNVGPPTPFAWPAGTWLRYVIGGTVDAAPGDGYIYRKNESIAKLGFLNINGNGTYI